MASETRLDIGNILFSQSCLFLFFRVRKSYGLGFMVKLIDSVDLFLFHICFSCPLSFFSEPILRVNALDIIQQRKFTALIRFKERSDLLAL